MRDGVKAVRIDDLQSWLELELERIYIEWSFIWETLTHGWQTPLRNASQISTDDAAGGLHCPDQVVQLSYGNSENVESANDPAEC